MIACSIMFGIVHVYFFRLPETIMLFNIMIFFGRYFITPFFVGIVFTILYEKSRNIIVPILVHNAVDTLYYVGMAVLNIFFMDLGGGRL